MRKWINSLVARYIASLGFATAKKVGEDQDVIVDLIDASSRK